MTTYMPRPLELLEMMGTIRDQITVIRGRLADNRDPIAGATHIMEEALDSLHEEVKAMAQPEVRMRDAQTAEQFALYAYRLTGHIGFNIDSNFAAFSKEMIPLLREAADRMAHSAGVARLNALHIDEDNEETHDAA